MGNHALAWHNHVFRDLFFTVLQIDELYTAACATALRVVSRLLSFRPAT
jgi:hypothetical protein